MPEPPAPRARRERSTFWIDDQVIDTYAPVMRRYRFGLAALAVYTALARRADRDGGSWPSLRTLAQQAATSERTVQRAIQLLELLGLVEVTSCYEAGSNRQTSNFYTLRTPPPVPPDVHPDPAQWPTPVRHIRVISDGPRAHAVTDARLGAPAAARGADDQAFVAAPGQAHQGPAAAPAEVATPRQAVTPPVSGWRGAPATQSPRPRQAVTPPPATQSPQEGTPREVTPVKDDTGPHDFSVSSFTIAEVGLSSRQVWAATLAELARGGAVSATELEAWLRPAALAGRDGETLLLAAPSRVARDRIAARLLPEVRRALAQVLGTEAPVSVVVAGQPATRSEYPGMGTRPQPNEWAHGLAPPSIPRTVSSRGELAF